MTNETLETIKSRRSCRAYKPEQITDEELNAVLEAGTYAASAMGRQSAKIVVVQDAATREKLSRGIASSACSISGFPFTIAASLFSPKRAALPAAMTTHPIFNVLSIY